MTTASADDFERRLSELVDQDRFDLGGLTALQLEAEASLGIDHPLGWEIATHRAWAMAGNGDPDGAIELVDRVLARASREDAQGSSATHLLARKAALLSQLDRDEEAALLWEQARRQWRVLEGELGARGLHAHYEQARCLGWSGDLTASSEAMSVVLELSDDVWGPLDEQTLSAMSFQAGTLRRLDEVDAALDVSRRLLARITAAHPADHERVIRVRKQVALDVRLRSGIDDALPLLIHLHQDADAALGSDHFETLDTAEEIAFSRGQTGDHTGADRDYRALFEAAGSAGELHLLVAAATRWVSLLEEAEGEGTVPAAYVDDAMRHRVSVLEHHAGPLAPGSLAARRAWGSRLLDRHDYDTALREFRVIATDFAGVLDADDALGLSLGIGSALRSLGRPQDAVDTLRTALDTHPTAHEVLHRNGQRALAMALTDLGRGDQAIALLQHLAETGPPMERSDLAVALIRDERYSDALAVLGPLAPEAAEIGGDLYIRVLGNTALATCGVGRHHDAAKLWNDLLALQLTQANVDPEDVLTTRHNLAREHAHTGHHVRAAELADEVIEGRGALLGHEHPLTLSSMSLRAWIGEGHDDPADVQRRLRELLATRTRVHGADHPSTRSTADDLARVLANSGDSAAADTVVRDTLSKVDGGSDPGQAALRRGELLEQRGQRTEALIEFRAAAQHFARSLGESAPDAVHARLAAADTVYFLRERRQAAEEYERLLPYLESADNMQVLMRTIDRYSSSLFSQGRHAEAIEVQRTAIGRAIVWAPEDPLTMTMRSRLGRRLAESGQHDEAETVYRGVAADRARVMGAEHRDTLDSRSDVAETLLAQGKAAAAAREFKTLVPAMTRHLGADDRDTIRAQGFQAKAAKAVARATLNGLGTAVGIGIAVIAILLIIAGALG